MPGKENLTVIDERLQDQCGQFWEIKTPENPWTDPQNTVRFTFKSSTKMSQLISEKKSSCLRQGEGERTQFEIHQCTLFFFTGPAFRGNYLDRDELAGVLSEPNWPQERKYPNPAHSSHSVALAEKEKKKKHQETLVLSIALMHRLTKKLRLNHRTIKHFLSPHTSLTTTLLKAYLQQFLLHGALCPTIKKKITRIPKR